ncbi:uncharacterized protein LOC110852648 isoform X3 [Folsomia candida]|uniref:uncharacterized protein LOC110852648 isoform X3 n=1 Tax=Folsomia candida TaxID=158441 RepID=UPI0016051EBA|nr:uncharacterized protein LOC110852648 isoform X3 [Folsomia candida]
MLIEKMVESSVIPTGPRSVANNKPIIDLNGLNNNNNNNNNNESDNEKPEPHEMNGHVIKTFDSLEDEDEEDEDFATASSSEEDDETPETGTCRSSHREGGVIPDVLLNELHEILVSSSSSSAGGEDGDEEISDDENGESWSSPGSSSSGGSGGSSPVLVLEAIPEEDSDWDSDTTLTEFSAGAEHARFPPLSDISTQPPPLQPSVLLPGPKEPSTVPAVVLHSECQVNKGPTQGPLVSLASSEPTTLPPTHPEGENTPTDSPTQLTESGRDSGNGTGSPTPDIYTTVTTPPTLSDPFKRTVSFLEPCETSSSAGEDSHEEEKAVLRKDDNNHSGCESATEQDGAGKNNQPAEENPAVQPESLLHNPPGEEQQTLHSALVSPLHIRPHGQSDPAPKSDPDSPHRKKVQRENGSFRVKKCVTFRDDCKQSGTRESFVSRGESGGGDKSEVSRRAGGRCPAGAAGVEEGEQHQRVLAAPSGPASEYFVVKLLAAEQQRQLDLVDLTKLTNNIGGAGSYDGGRELSKFIEAETAGSYFSDNNNSETSGEMHQRLSSSCSEHQHLPPGVPREKPRSVLRKVGAAVKKSGRNVSFNESLNLFYEAECQCWIHEEDYARLRHEEQMQQQLIYEQATQLHQLHHHHHHHHTPYLTYEPPPLEFEDTPTLSPPEGYKDRFFPQMMEHHQLQQQLQQQQQQQQQSSQDPDVTRVSPPSPPAARRKVFLKESNSPEQQPPVMNHTHHRPILNGLEEEEDEESRAAKKGSRQNQSQQVEMDEVMVTHRPTQVSIGTAPLRTSEQIRLAVDSTLRMSRSKKNKQECSSLVEKLRWLTSLDDEDSSDSQSVILDSTGFATWPSRDKNGAPNSAPSSTTSSSRKSDAGTSTSEEFVHPTHAMRLPISANEAKIKQISYTLEDIDEGLKGGDNELETFITEDGMRLERIRRRYGEDVGGDDYGFSRRPSVKGIKPKFSSTNQIFAQFTRAGAETPIPQMQMQIESQYENMRPISNSHYEPLPPNGAVGGGGGEGGNNGSGARVNLNYDQFPPNPTPTSSSSSSGAGGVGGAGNNGNVGGNGNGSLAQQQPTVRPGIASSEESRSHFEMIRQSFEQASFVSYNRPHSWSVSTLPHNHTHANATTSTGHIPLPGIANNLSGSALNIQSGAGPPQGQPQQPQNNLSMGVPLVGMNGATGMGGTRPNSMPIMGPQQQQLYGTLPHQMMGPQQQGPGGQPIYGTVRRVPNVIGRPLFLHYGALSVEAHPNKLVQPYPPTKVPETPSPTQQQPPAPINNIKYYGPPIRYYNPPPPVPPRSATTAIGGAGNGDCIGLERGNPEGATDEEPSIKEPYSMNV